MSKMKQLNKREVLSPQVVDLFSEDLYNLGTENIIIPMPGYAESLNAGVAGSIIMYEAVRQRI